MVFDGQCLLCNGWVKFLLRHDQRGVFRFAAIQSRTGQALLQQAGLQVEGLQTLLLVARHRYWIFGRTETCMVPSPDMTARFLD